MLKCHQQLIRLARQLIPPHMLERRNAHNQIVTLVGLEIQNIDIPDAGRGLVLVNDFMFRIKIVRQSGQSMGESKNGNSARQSNSGSAARNSSLSS